MIRACRCRGAAALIAAGSAAPASAQAFKPTKPIEIVVHNGPGSGPDIFGRTVAQAIEQEKLAPVRFQVSNKVGGGGVTAANYMVERKGDSACARRLHQRLDDQSAGAAGGERPRSST